MEKEEMRPVLGIRLFKGNKKSFGPGIAQLLVTVQKKHSLRAAAADMNMAYSKAWRILNETEDVLGFALLRRTTGGKHGGGAVLTPEGEAMLQAYTAYSQALMQQAESLLEEYFNVGDPEDG